MAADSKSKAMDPKPDASKDPSAGLMDMMKKMYEEGDDEMKRTIAKAWTEGQDKKVRSQEFSYFPRIISLYLNILRIFSHQDLFH